MRRVAFVVVLTCLAVLVPTVQRDAAAQGDAEDQTVVSFYILAGQSNAVGLGQTRLRNAILDQNGPDTDSRITHVGGYAVNGSSLRAGWLTDGTADSSNDGVVYTTFLSRIEADLRRLATDYPDAEVRFEGMWWHQGENDSPLDSAAYEALLVRFLADVRVSLEQPRLPVFIARLMPTLAGYHSVREAQVDVGADDPYSYTVSLDGVVGEHGGHYTSAGYDRVAERAALSMAEIRNPSTATCGTYLVHVEECATVTVDIECQGSEATLSVSAVTRATTAVDVTVTAGDVDPMTASLSAATPIDFDLTIEPDPDQASDEVNSEAPTVAVTVATDAIVVHEDEVEIPECFDFGDIDGSGDVSDDDINLVLDHLIGLTSSDVEQRGDLDGSGAVALNDARYLAACLARADCPS